MSYSVKMVDLTGFGYDDHQNPGIGWLDFHIRRYRVSIGAQDTRIFRNHFDILSAGQVAIAYFEDGEIDPEMRIFAQNRACIAGVSPHHARHRNVTEKARSYFF